LNKLFSTLTLTCALALSVGIVHAQSEQQIRSDLQKKIGPNTKIKSVSLSPIPGIYEVLVGNDVVYTDANSKY
jgi:thiol:disulfide interchange protein DsbC